MKSPLVIIVELLFGLFSGVYEGIIFVIGKMGELFVSLVYLSSFGLTGFLLALGIGAVVFVLCAKFLMKSYRSLVVLGVAFLAFLAVLVLLWMI